LAKQIENLKTINNVPVKIQIANERKQRSERSSENNHQRQ
jgi:hypothetical protein